VWVAANDAVIRGQNSKKAINKVVAQMHTFSGELVLKCFSFIFSSPCCYAATEKPQNKI
jgi:hypothetical protein